MPRSRGIGHGEARPSSSASSPALRHGDEAVVEDGRSLSVRVIIAELPVCVRYRLHDRTERMSFRRTRATSTACEPVYETLARGRVLSRRGVEAVLS
jgi:hypothetical protein